MQTSQEDHIDKMEISSLQKKYNKAGAKAGANIGVKIGSKVPTYR